MSYTTHHRTPLGATIVLLALTLAFCASASAAQFEQTGTFAETGEELQLGGIGGMAVNVSGAGGVPAGTVYAATNDVFQELRVARFSPSGDELKFSEGWQVTQKEEAYEVCGSDSPDKAACPTRAHEASAHIDVEVDQETGNVYVFNGEIAQVGFKLITVYSADGSEVITRFGERAEAGKTTAETPGKMHGTSGSGGIAVNEAGDVYVFDLNNGPDNFYHRLMVFKPKTPGKFDEYEYVPGADIGAGFLNEGNFPTKPVTDTAGNIYVAGESYVEEYDPTTPKKPICEFKFAKGGITAMTVNGESGEPFFYTSIDKKIHQLGPCEGGKFKEKSSFGMMPTRGNVYALAFDHKRALEGRAPGVLYAGVPEANFEPSKNSLGYIFAGAEENPPVVESEEVTGVDTESAELHALINPKGFETRYAFQYLTTAAYVEAGKSFEEASEAPLEGAVLGGGKAPIAAAVTLTGLSPDTPYTYRAIATSHCAPSEPEKVCEATGSAQGLHTYPPGAGAHPDFRAYELVSPAQKNGGQVFPADPITSSCGTVECKPGAPLQHFPMLASPDGEAALFEGNPFSPSEGAVIENEYVSRRDASSGWQTVNLTPPLLASKGGQGYKDFSPDLTESVLEAVKPSLSPEAPLDFSNLYRQPTDNPLALKPLLTAEPPHRVSGGGAGALRVFYAGASADLSRLFFAANDELNGEGGGGEKEEINLYESSAGQLHLVNLGPGEEVLPGAKFGSGAFNSDYVVSADGSRAFWSSKAGQLYVRIGGSETVEIPSAAKFLTATPDGSKVLLSDGSLYGQLAGGSPVKEADLSGGEGGFQGLVGQSEDLSHIYFIDTAELGGEGQPEKPNLYAFIEGTTTYVTTLLEKDNENNAGDWAPSPLVRTAEASPEGRFLSFLSKAQLTGVPNVGLCEIIGETNEAVDAPCPEVFLYDSVTGELTCPSCNPSGQAPLGHSVLRINLGVGGAPPQPRYLAASGRLYFDTQDSLVPTDTNEGVEDVYQYEPQGVGGCTREGGCVAMISAGRGAADSNFLAMDESGDNVFFTTRDRLVAADTDQLYDLYDARVNGGFSFESQAPSLSCQGEGCQPPPASQPESPPASQNTTGPGNVKPAPKKCKKGQVKRGNRCVKKTHKKHRAKHRAAHKRGGAR